MLSTPARAIPACSNPTSASTSKLRSLLLRAAALVVAAIANPAFAVVPADPVVVGPITGPGEMFPGIRPGPAGTNPEDFGYITEEYFVTGTAAGQPYKTRIVVRKPARPQAFSGVVVAEPMHRGGNALICQFARFGILQRGHACLEIVARPINLNNNNNPVQSLQPFNPARYGDFKVTAAQTNEIIAQVGRYIKRNPRSGPLARYQVERIVLTGTSDSSAATRGYMSPGHSDFRMETGGPIYDGFFVSAILGPTTVAITDVPTIAMPTQFELHSTNAFRRPDSDTLANRYRTYEVAGMSHNDAREGTFPGCVHPELGRLPYGAMTFMGLQHLIDWTYGVTPPKAQPMEVDNDISDGTRVALDEFGNARGGVRSTYLDVPLYTYSIPNAGPGLCNQTSWQTRLSDEVLGSLYGNKGQYVSRLQQRLHELIDEGWFPKEYVVEYVIGDMRAEELPVAR